MILCLMGFDDLPDHDEAKPRIIVSNIYEVELVTIGPMNERALKIMYNSPNRSLMEETFVLRGNAYLMNNDGKTINTFRGNVFRPDISTWRTSVEPTVSALIYSPITTWYLNYHSPTGHYIKDFRLEEDNPFVKLVADINWCTAKVTMTWCLTHNGIASEQVLKLDVQHDEANTREVTISRCAQSSSDKLLFPAGSYRVKVEPAN